MNLFILAFYFAVSFGGVINAMEDASDVNNDPHFLALKSMPPLVDGIIKANECPFVTERSIQPLTRLCIPALNAYVRAQIQHNPQFNVTQFENLLLLIGEHSSYLQQSLAQEIDTVPLEIQYEEDKNEKENYIYEIKLAGSNMIISQKEKALFTRENKLKKIASKKRSHITSINDNTFVDGRKYFSISNNGRVAYLDKTSLYLQLPSDINDWLPISFLNELSLSESSSPGSTKGRNSCACVTFSPNQDYCFVGTTGGEIFRINFPAVLELTKKISKHSIKALYCATNGCVYVSDDNEKNFVWYNEDIFELPFKQHTKEIISSADNNLVAFQHQNNEEVSIVDWHARSIVTLKLGKIVAITPDHTIIASRGEELLFYNIHGELLNKIQLSAGSTVFGNTVPSFDPQTPLYVVATKEEQIIVVDDYETYDDTWIPSMSRAPNCKKVGSHTEKKLKNCLWFPKQLSTQELFDELSKLRKKE